MIGLIAASFLAAPSRAQDRTVELRPGATVGGRIWAALADTTLDPKSEEPLGGSDTLGSTDGTTILLRWSDLRRFLGDGPVRSASLRLVGSMDGASVKRIARLRTPWAEGPADTISGLFRPQKESDRKELPAPYAATWRMRLGKEADWQGPGATGPADTVPVEGVTVSRTDDGAVVEGLGPLIGRFRDRPETNCGILIEFDKPVGFASAQAPLADRPALSVTVAPAPVDRGNLSVESLVVENGGWTARVRNGSKIRAANLRAIWTRDGRTLSETSIPDIDPSGGARVTLPGNVQVDPADDRRHPVSLRIEAATPDPFPADDVLIGYPGGTAADVDRDTAEGFNETWAPGSRASFAPDGVLRRINVGPGKRIESGDFGAVARLLGAPDLRPLSVAPDLDPFPGPNGGDARFEGTVPPAVSMAAALSGPGGATPTGLFSLTDIAFLNGRGAVKQARSALVKIVDGRGVGIPRQAVTVRKFDLAGKPVGDPVVMTTDAAGSLVFSADPNATEWSAATPLGAARASFTVVPEAAGPGGESVTRTLKAWELVDAASRSKLPVAIVELRFELPLVAIDRATDLAEGRPVADKAGRAPGDLAPLTEKGGLVWTAVPGDWIEVDLGRDRTLAEIELESTGTGGFDVLGYATGDRPEDAVVLGREPDVETGRRNRPGPSRYYPAPRRTRYVRLIARKPGTVTLGKLRIRPIRVVTGG